MWNDCCSDIADIGCYHPASTSSPMVSPTPDDTLSKTKSEAHKYIIGIVFLIN